MHANLLWDDHIESVLQEIGKFGLDPATINHYRQTYKRIKEYAAARNVRLFCDSLIRSFLHDIEEQHQAGVIGRGRRAHLRRASLILQEYVANGSIRWTTYTCDRQPLPKSRELLLLHANFIDDLEASNKSANTIQSSTNSVRQFLLFLEDFGCTSLALASASLVPAFFQHLLATYGPQVLLPWLRISVRFCASAKPTACCLQFRHAVSETSRSYLFFRIRRPLHWNSCCTAGRCHFETRPSSCWRCEPDCDPLIS